jgi:hypothetical protein
MTETFDKLDEGALSALQARNLPRLRAADLLVADDNAADPVECARLIEAAEEYCGHFLPRRANCVCCDSPLASLFGGSFTWGLAHGEGFCGMCSYPCRAVHRIAGVGTLRNYILQYHPAELIKRVA